MTAPPRLSSEILDRLPPQDPEAEKNLIGSVFLNPALLDDLWTALRPEDFAADANRRLYCHALAMRDAGTGLDVTTLLARLRVSNELEAVGGPAYLAEVAQSVPVAAHARYYAEIIIRHSKARRIIHAATEALRGAWDPTQDPREVINRAEAELGAIQTGDFRGEPRPVSEIVPEALARIETAKSTHVGGGVMVGLDNFDQSIGGLFPGELSILAARPSVGKTSLACQFAHHVATRRGAAYFASLEMGQVELANRMICTLGGVSSRRIRTGDIRDEDYRLLAYGGNELGKANLFLHDRPGLTVADIRRSCRRLVKHGLVLIVVDYLQLITPSDGRVKRYEQVGQIVKDLKATALELSVPLLCLCQLNRETEREGKTPRLHNLRESGDIEQTADVVLFLHRDQPTKEKPRPTRTLLNVAKNRNGETGPVWLEWEAMFTRYRCAQAENRETAFNQYSGDFAD